MLFDPDHMSVKARKPSLDLIESMDYSGVLSSHSWSTPDAYPRIYQPRRLHRAVRRRQHRLRREVAAAPRAGPTSATTWASGSAPTSTASARRADPRGADVAEPGDLPVHHPRRRQGRPAGQRRARLRHQQGRRRALRPLPRLDPGPEDAGRGDDIVEGHVRAAPRPTSRRGSAQTGIKPNACRNPGLRSSSPHVLARGSRPGMTLAADAAAPSASPTAGWAPVHLLLDGGP